MESSQHIQCVDKGNTAVMEYWARRNFSKKNHNLMHSKEVLANSK